jgi:hypothetical protein
MKAEGALAAPLNGKHGIGRLLESFVVKHCTGRQEYLNGFQPVIKNESTKGRRGSEVGSVNG